MIIADHTAGIAGKSDLPVEGYHIPMLVYAPGIISPEQNDTIASQIDVVPTLLSLLNENYRSGFFSKYILSMQVSSGRALIANYQHLGYYTQGKLSILSPGKKVSQYINPENTQGMLNPSPDESHISSVVAYYQAADYIYNHKLNL